VFAVVALPVAGGGGSGADAAALGRKEEIAALKCAGRGLSSDDR